MVRRARAAVRGELVGETLARRELGGRRRLGALRPGSHPLANAERRAGRNGEGGDAGCRELPHVPGSSPSLRSPRRRTTSASSTTRNDSASITVATGIIGGRCSAWRICPNRYTGYVTLFA